MPRRKVCQPYQMKETPSVETQWTATWVFKSYSLRICSLLNAKWKSFECTSFFNSTFPWHFEISSYLLNDRMIDSQFLTYFAHFSAFIWMPICLLSFNLQKMKMQWWLSISYSANWIYQLLLNCDTCCRCTLEILCVWLDITSIKTHNYFTLYCNQWSVH